MANPERAEGNAFEQPAYTIGEAARYLELPAATLRYWAVGARTGRRKTEPVIELPAPGFLSFINLVEAHVLSALRQHRMSLQSIRRAVDFLRERLGSEHPLADKTLATDGLDLFVERYGQLVNASKHGQLAMRQVLERHLERLEWSPTGLVIRLYPFTRTRGADEPRRVVIDPRVQFGRPVIVGSGIPTSIIAERFKAGESINELVEDYGRTADEIQEAIRCELHLDQAA